MTKVKLVRVVNMFLFLIFVLQAATGLFRRLIPPELFGRLHPASGILLTALVLIHLVLNWKWIKLNYFNKK